MPLNFLFPYHATTEGVTVRVTASFLPEQSAVKRGQWFWAYHIRIENGRAAPVQLLARHWKITNGHGEVTYVDGDGVVGEQPWIKPGGAHDYVSGCPLPTAFGSMQGTFLMVDFDNERRFLAEIPLFHLKVDEASA